MMTPNTLKSLVRGEEIPMPSRPKVKILRLPPKKEKAALAALLFLTRSLPYSNAGTEILLRMQSIQEKRDAK